MRSKPALHDLMSAAFGSLASVLLLAVLPGWAYMLLLLSLLLLLLVRPEGWGVLRAGFVVADVVSVGAREGWSEGAPE